MKYYKKEREILALGAEETAPAGFVEITKKEFEHLESVFTRLAELHFELKKTDFKAIKHSEGLISDEDYEPIKSQRQEWRQEINELEEELK